MTDTPEKIELRPQLRLIRARYALSWFLRILVLVAAINAIGVWSGLDVKLILASSVAALVVGGTALLFTKRYRNITAKNFLMHLNRVTPALEESAQLLLKNPAELSGLQKLQAKRVRGRYEDTLRRPELWLPPLRLRGTAGLIFICSFLAVMGILRDTSPTPKLSALPASNHLSSSPASILDMQITVIPPHYTGHPTLVLKSADIEAKEGSQIIWSMQFSREDGVYFIKDTQGERYPLIRDRRNTHSVTLPAKSTLLYQFVQEINGTETPIGGLYTLAVHRDAKPVIRLINPKGTTLEFAKNDLPQFSSVADISDDFGVSSTYILASVAKGTGEAVKFRDEVFKFDSSHTDARQNGLYTKEWDLQKLGMEPGDEIYFSVVAHDNRAPNSQEAKSATVIARWLNDEKATIGAEGIVSDFIPEYFKSQRQIIIETEQLIADKKTLDAATFSRTSQSLGQAQSDLKQRYGQYLGDEFGEGPGEQLSDRSTSHNSTDDQHKHTEVKHDNETAEVAPPEVGHQHEVENLNSRHGSAEALIQRFGHAHEDADIGPIAKRDPKTLMKKAVSIMWNAELHLMLANPEKALPFEREALKYLKLAKQADRIYVKRLGFEPPPVSEKSRLQGDLKEIESYHKAPVGGWEASEEQKLIQRVFNALNQDQPISNAERENITLLSKKFIELSQHRPAFIKHAAVLEKILSAGTFSLKDCPECVSNLQAALWDMIDMSVAPPLSGYGYHDTTDPFTEARKDP
ncbi:DUF4175 family protein [Kordiimonas sp.]|uniref:DUF4175 family protein n=1 Tax=Kordiimonas sp. TaxID=1970157 RepID=UPI003A8E1E13